MEATVNATQAKLREIALASETASIGHNRKIKNEMADAFEAFEPFTKTLDAAQRLAINALQKAKDAENGINANRLCELAVTFGEVAKHAHDAGFITLDVNALPSFRAYINKWDFPELAVMNVTDVVAKNSEGGDVSATIESVSLMKSVSPQLLTSAMEIGLLYVAQDETHVTLGCHERKGVITRFNIGHIFEPIAYSQRATMERTHYVAMCVPHNVLKPFQYIHQSPTDGLPWLKLGARSEVTRLCYLDPRIARLLYLHHFAKKQYKIDTHGVNGKPPTGMIVGVEATQASTRTNNGTGEIDPLVKLARAADRAIAFGEDSLAAKMNDCATAMITLAPDQWKCPTGDVIGAALRAARAAREVLKKFPKVAQTDQVRPELLQLWTDLSGDIIEDDNGDYVFNPDGAGDVVLKDDLQALPVDVNPSTATLVKAEDASEPETTTAA